MIFNFGTRNYIISEKYVSDIECRICERKTEHILTVFCKTFVMGILYPIKWWAWGKTGRTTCTKCGHTSVVDGKNPNTPAKIFNYYRETKIPKHYFIPMLISALLFLAVCLLFAFGVFAGILSAITPLKSKLKGKWKDEYNTSVLYVYKDYSYTFVSNDNIVFGDYVKESGKIRMPFFGQENIVSKENLNPMKLSKPSAEQLSFVKIKEDGMQNLFRKNKNTWRIPADHPESNAQIRNRVLAYLNFEKQKFETAIQNSGNFVQRDPYAPIIFAGNGFAMNGNSLANWRGIFNNENNWQKANSILHEEFPNEFNNELEENAFKRAVDFLNLYIKKVKESNLQYLEKAP